MENSNNTFNHDAWLQYCKDLLDITKNLAGCQIVSPNTPHHIEVAKIVAFKFTQAVRTFRSIILLEDSGDTTNSYILVRSLFENFVDIVYLVRNPKDVWRYIEESFETIQKIGTAKEIYAPILEINLTGPEWEKYKKNIIDLANEHSSCRSWRKLSLRSRAEKSEYPNVVAWYNMIYPQTSSFVHGSSLAFIEYLISNSTSPNSFRFDYSRVDDETKSSTRQSAMIFLDYLSFINRLFDAGLDSSLDKCFNDQQKLLEIVVNHIQKKYKGSYVYY